MSHQPVPARLNEKVSCASPSAPVQSTSSGICIKQEYFEDQLPVIVKTESESAPNEHNIMQSIKVEVKEEHYHDQDCPERVLKRELDFDEGEQMDTKIKVKVEDASSGQLVQHFKCVKKEEEDGGEYVMECDCEDCETCRVKMEMKEERDESGETELGGNCSKVVQGFTRVKKEEGEDDGEVERPYKIRRMDRVVGNVPVGSPLPNVISINIECLDGQMSTSSTNPTTIEDHTRPSQPVTLPTPIVTPSQSSSAQNVNETLRGELLNGEPMIDNVVLVAEVRADEFDRKQIDGDSSTLNPVHTDQDDEETEVDDNPNDGEQVDEQDDGDETTGQREDLNTDDGQQVTAESFVKRIEPTDELGNKFECDYRGCGKRMKYRSNLITHIRTHTGEKPFKCSVEGCDRAFVRDAELKEHLNTHTGTRPFVCSWPECEARFGSKSNLTVHLRTHTSERPFKCDQCDADFNQQAHLVTHLRTHTGDRPFICTWPDCGQAFSCSSILKAHSLVHSNERQFVCDVTDCTKVYKSKGSLRKHQKAKHN